MAQKVCYNLYQLPYSAKYSRHLYFVDWPLKAISLHNVRGMTAYRKPHLKFLHVIDLGNLTIFVDLINPRKLSPSKISRYTVYGTVF